MNNTQLKVKQQVIDYLNNYEATGDNELDNLFNKPKHEVYKFALDLTRGESTVYSKDEYVDYVKGLSNSFKDNEETKDVHAKWLKQFEEKDFDAMFVSADSEIFFFKNGDFAQEEMDSHREEIEQYLWNYNPTQSTEFDEKFGIFKSDVSDLAKGFRNDEVYVYTKIEFLDILDDMAYDAEEQDREYFEQLQNEIKERNFDVLVDKSNDYYYYI